MELINIEDMEIQHIPKALNIPTYTKVTYCDKGQRFVFQQLTAKGLKTVILPIGKIGQKVIFKSGFS